MITYNDLYEALRKERYSEQLQLLTKKFIKEVSEYLKEKKQMGNKEEEIFSEAMMKNKKQYENAVSMFKELMLRRKKKILNLVFIATETGVAKRDYENMTDYEKSLFEKIMEAINASEREMNKIMEGQEAEEEKTKLVLLKEKIPEFLDMTGEKQGPYEKGEIANLGTEIAGILISSGKAEIIEEE